MAPKFKTVMREAILKTMSILCSVNRTVRDLSSAIFRISSMVLDVSTGDMPQVSLQKGIAELIKGYQVVRRNEYSNV